MSSFSDLRKTFRFQREAKRIRKELRKIHVEAEASGVLVIVSAEQEIVTITIAESVERERIPELLKDALNRAMKKAQIVASEKMQGIMGNMGVGTGE